jgi:hypothetical protein
VTLAETGEETDDRGPPEEGARLYRRAHLLLDLRRRRWADVDIGALLAFHRGQGALATVTGVQPPGRYGEIRPGRRPDRVLSSTRSRAPTGVVSGGFFVFERGGLRLPAATTRRCSGSTSRWPAGRRGRCSRPTSTRASGTRWTRTATTSTSTRSGAAARRPGRCGERRAGGRLPLLRRAAGRGGRRPRAVAARQLLETFYPLHARVCERCFLVQLGRGGERRSAIFSRLRLLLLLLGLLAAPRPRVREGIERAAGARRRSQVVEIASNDGYLLQYFVAAGSRCSASSRRRNVARAAEERGVPTLVRFFGAALARELAEQGTRADLVVGNNVLAHVPALNDFVAGPARPARAPGGAHHGVPAPAAPAGGEPVRHHLPRALLLLLAAHGARVFAAHGLELFDVEELETHGGSLRIHARAPRTRRAAARAHRRVDELLERERRRGCSSLDTYRRFSTACAGDQAARCCAS